mmetsp:Transcript_14660/g.18464  ORF Transcript_14660/g.18464 Transcript_14660/m.18464 type:complete len:153 (-) Transcript_14660:436-894(-)
MYYIRMRYASRTFIAMIKRACELCSKNTDIACEADDILIQFRKIQQFIMWDYSHNHLQLSSNDSAHCCTFALDGDCDHEHSQTSCNKCCSVMKLTSTDGPVAKFLENVHTAGGNHVVEEVPTMKNAVPRLREMLKYYLAHRLRANVQFFEID